MLWGGNEPYADAAGTILDGLWIGTADGSGRRISDEPGHSFHVAGNHVYYLSGRGASEYEAGLWAIVPGAQPTPIGSGGWFDVATDAGLGFSARDSSDGGLGVWVFPLGGGEPRLLIPPGPAAHQRIAASSDGRRVAVERCGFQGEGGLPMQLAIDGVVSDLDGAGMPLGFDEAGRLIYWDGCAQKNVVRRSDDGRVEILLSAGYSEARVTRDGRYLAAITFAERDPDRRLVVIRLDSLGTWSATISGDWQLTSLGDNEYAVLQGLPPGEERVPHPLVASLDGQWWGVLKPLPAGWC